MTDQIEYHQYQCEQCGFRTRSPDRSETIEVVQRHESDKHDNDRSEEEISDKLRELELEGLPDNS